MAQVAMVGLEDAYFEDISPMVIYGVQDRARAMAAKNSNSKSHVAGTIAIGAGLALLGLALAIYGSCL